LPHPLSRLCQKTLHEYINKETHLRTIKNEKYAITQSSQTESGEEGQAKVEQKDIKPLEIQEGILVRQIQSLTPLIQK